MIIPLSVVARPRGALAAVARNPRPGPAIAAVSVTAMGSLVLNLLATGLEAHSARTPGYVVSLSLPVLFVVFWLLSGLLIDAGAQLMTAGRRRRDFLLVSAHAFPALLAYAVIALAQVAAVRWLGAAGSTISNAVGLLALPVLAWFITLSTLAVRSVYELPTLSAMALAMLPFAFLAAAILVLILAITALRL